MTTTLPNADRRAATSIGRREFVGFGLGAFVAAAIPLAARRPAVVRRAMPVMGTVAQFAVVHRDPAAAHAAIDAAAAELLWVERTMTRFTETSDIGRANRLAAPDATTRRSAACARSGTSATAMSLRQTSVWPSWRDGASTVRWRWGRARAGT